MHRLLVTFSLLVALTFVTACQRTVSPEGYVSETPVESYVRNLPKAYSGQRHIVLKPPALQTAAPVAAETTDWPDTQESGNAGVAQFDAPAYTSQPLPPLAVTQSAQTLTPQELSPAPVAPAAYAPSPVLTAVMPSRPMLAQPSAIMTREVDYGRDITIYPLDRDDAPMPYIPPAPAYEAPPVSLKKPVVKASSGLNK